jgi:hypothetical protein
MKKILFFGLVVGGLSMGCGGEAVQEEDVDVGFDVDELAAIVKPPIMIADPPPAVTATSITINWTDTNAREESYQVFRRSYLGPYKLIASVAKNATSYKDHVQPSTQYHYVVRAQYGSAVSKYSNEVGAKSLPSR